MEDLSLSSPLLASFLLGGGIALLIVPTWIRWAIAVTMIGLGLAGLFPDLLGG